MRTPSARRGPHRGGLPRGGRCRTAGRSSARHDALGTARHKLVDHWRREAREERWLHAVASDPTSAGRDDDPWEARLDSLRAHEVLGRLGPHHRSALTLRYLDDLPVPQVAALLDRTLHATEALLVRARTAFRTAYTATGEEYDGD